MKRSRIAIATIALCVGIVFCPWRAIAETETSPAEVGARDTALGTSEAESYDTDHSQRSFRDRIWLNYYGVYYGSSVSSPSLYQSGPYREKDQNRPSYVKNFITAGYDINENLAFAATGYFVFVPGATDQFAMQDPSIRLADSSILHIGGFNWYGDARVHFPVTNASRMNDMLWGFQSFHYFSYQWDDSRWNPGIYASARYNRYGKLGVGNDVDLYLAPALNYTLSENVALTFLYELGASHTFGDDPGNLDNEGTDFQPGVLWRITPALEVNPYLNIYTGGRIAWDTTSFGMTLSWMLM